MNTDYYLNFGVKTKPVLEKRMTEFSVFKIEISLFRVTISTLKVLESMFIVRDKMEIIRVALKIKLEKIAVISIVNNHNKEY